LPKTTFRAKIGGGWARGASKKLGTPTYFYVASNFKFGTQIGFGTSLPKTTFRTKIGGGLGQGCIPKNWDPLRIFATVEANNFKFGTRIGFGTSLPKTTLRTKIGVWARGASKKNLGPPYVFLQPLKLATSNLVHKLGLGLSYQTNNV